MPSAEELLPLRARRLDWAALLARVWEIDVLKCPRCANGRMEVIAAISELSVVAYYASFDHLVSVWSNMSF